MELIAPCFEQVKVAAMDATLADSMISFPSCSCSVNTPTKVSPAAVVSTTCIFLAGK